MAAISVASSVAPITSMAVPVKGTSSLAGTPVKLPFNLRAPAAPAGFHHKVTLVGPRMNSSDAEMSSLNEQLEMSKRQFVTALLVSAAGVVLPCCQGAQSARAEPAPAKTEAAPAQAKTAPAMGYTAGYMPIKGPCCE